MKIFETFDLKEELKVRNRKEYGFIRIALKPTGEWVNLPILMVIGAEDGPVILADACSHGDEHEGAEGIIKAYHALNPAVMKGSFIGVPVVNLEAFTSMRRYGEADFVPVDLNRAYPGKAQGSLTQSVGNYHFKNLVENADALITIHGGGNHLYLEPITLYQNYNDEISAKSKEMAKAFGFDALWQNSICIKENGIMDELAYLSGVPAITPEIGGQSTRVEHRDEHIEKTKNGIFNVLRLWNVLDEEVETSQTQYHVDVEYLYCTHGGFTHPQKKGGERVKKGETLAIITNVFGEEVDRLLAPFDGKVIGYWAYSVCQPKSWIYMVGHELEE